MGGLPLTGRSKTISTFLVHKAVYKLSNAMDIKQFSRKRKTSVHFTYIEGKQSDYQKRGVMAPQLSHFQINEIRQNTNKLRRTALHTRLPETKALEPRQLPEQALPRADRQSRGRGCARGDRLGSRGSED